MHTSSCWFWGVEVFVLMRWCMGYWLQQLQVNNVDQLRRKKLEHYFVLSTSCISFSFSIICVAGVCFWCLCVCCFYVCNHFFYLMDFHILQLSFLGHLELVRYLYRALDVMLSITAVIFMILYPYYYSMYVSEVQQKQKMWIIFLRLAKICQYG